MITTMKRLIFIGSVLLFAGCDKGFVKENTDPYAITSIDPALLFAGAQRSHIGTWYGEHMIVQQFVVPYNTEANLGFNFNEDILWQQIRQKVMDIETELLRIALKHITQKMIAG